MTAAADAAMSTSPAGPPMARLARTSHRAAKVAWMNPPMRRTRLDHDATGVRSVSSSVIAAGVVVFMTVLLAVGAEGGFDGLLERRMAGAERGDAEAVDDEGPVELVEHLDRFPGSGLEQPEGTQGQDGYPLHPGTGVPGGLVSEVEELAGGAGTRVVRQVPDLARGVGMLAQDGQAGCDVGDVAVGVRLVGVAEDLRLAAGQGRSHGLVAEVDGLGGAPRPEVVRGAPDGDLDPSGRVGGHQVGVHPGPHRALAG